MTNDLTKHRYVDLLSMRIPSWAGSLVGNFRRDADIPAEISDLLIFVAIEANGICTFNEEADKIAVLRAAFALPEKKAAKRVRR